MLTTEDASLIATAENFLIFYKKGKIKIWLNCDEENIVTLKSEEFRNNIYTFIKDPAKVPQLLRLVYNGNYVYSDREVIKVPKPEPPKDICPIGGVSIK